MPSWGDRAVASSPGRAGTLAASLELLLHGVKEFGGPVWPSSVEKPRPGCEALLDVESLW